MNNSGKTGSSLSGSIVIVVVSTVVGLVAPLLLLRYCCTENERIYQFVVVMVLLLFSGVAGLKRVREGNISSVFYLSYFVIFGVAQLMASLMHSEFPFTIDVRLKAGLINVAVLLCFYVGESLVLASGIRGRSLNSVPTDLAKQEKTELFLSVLMRVSLLLSFSGLAIFVYAKGIPMSSLFLYEVRTLYRLKGNWALMNLGAWMFSLNLVSSYVSLVRKKYVIFALSAGVALLGVFVFGGRAYLLFFVGPAVYYYLSKIRLDFRRAVILTSLAVVFTLSLGVFHLFRWNQERTLRSLIDQLTDRNTYSFILNDPRSEFNYRLRTFQAVEEFPKNHGWLCGNTYRTMLLFWLPSGLSGGLKEDTMYKFADVLTGTTTAISERRSVQPTFTGDCYINFGGFFWIPALIWGMAFGFAYRKARSSPFWNTLVGSTSVYFLLLFVRGSIYQSSFVVLICASYIALMMMLVHLGESRVRVSGTAY